MSKQNTQNERITEAQGINPDRLHNSMAEDALHERLTDDLYKANMAILGKDAADWFNNGEKGNE